MRIVIHVLFVLLLGLITFFGLGPVLLADGSDLERLITLLFVLLAYAIVIFVYAVWRKRRSSR